ncbi:hypothetical protein EQH57_1094, partial [Dictyocoela roeselum]
ENNVGELETDDTKMRVLRSGYFCPIYTSGDQDNPNPEEIIAERRIVVLSTVKFSPVEIISCIDKLNVTKSPGPDQVHPRILKKCRNEIAEHLSNISTQYLTNGTCHSKWKEINVTLI